MITESDRLASALEMAAELWPEANGEKGVLLRRLLDAGIENVERKMASREQVRHDAISNVAGIFTGVWPTGWREELRDEWPT